MPSKKMTVFAWVTAAVTLILFGIILCVALFTPKESDVQIKAAETQINSYKQQVEMLTKKLDTASASSKDESGKPASDEDEKRVKIELAAAQTALLCSQNNQRSLENRSTYSFIDNNRYVYLTIDDCPSSLTPKILEVLKENDVKATFFVVYNKNPEYYKQIVEQGHTIALHSYTHDYSQVYKSVDNYFEDLNKISDYVKGITGIESKIVRFPGGSSNTVSRKYQSGVITDITRQLNDKGYLYYDWNAQVVDATTKGATAAQLLQNTKNFTTVNGIYKPFVMLLMHNSADRQSTIDALPSIISYYKENGYNFEVITQTTPTVHQPIQN